MYSYCDFPSIVAPNQSSSTVSSKSATNPLSHKKHSILHYQALLTIFRHSNSPWRCVWAQTYTSFSSHSVTVGVVWMLRECSDGGIVCDQLKLCSCFHFCNVDSVVYNDAISVLWKWWLPAQDKCPRVSSLSTELKRSCFWNCM